MQTKLLHEHSQLQLRKQKIGDKTQRSAANRIVVSAIQVDLSNSFL